MLGVMRENLSDFIPIVHVFLIKGIDGVVVAIDEKFCMVEMKPSAE
jgi:hypothetical protein